MRFYTSVLAVAALSIMGCQSNVQKKNTAAAEATPEPKIEFKTSLNPKSDSKVHGLVTFVQEGKWVQMDAHIMGLDPGTHAIHLHQKADCSSADGKSTGGHWNPTFEAHGKWGAMEGFHRGDIGNFEADSTGHAHVVFKTDLWCLDCSDDTKNIMGKAIIVHQGIDDFVSQPSGAAGARVSCAGIIE